MVNITRYIAILLSICILPSGILAQAKGPKTLQIPLIKGNVVELGLSSRYATALKFPGEVGAVLGFGLTDGTELGIVQYSLTQDSRILMLRQILEDRDMFLTVVVDDEMYHFHLFPQENALIGLEFIDVREALPRAEEIKLDDVLDRRTEFDAERMYNMLKITREYKAYAKYIPQIYENSERREMKSKYDYGEVETNLFVAHKYPKEDAVVFLGEIENKTDKTIYFEPSALKVRVGKRELPVLFTHTNGELEPNSRTPTHILIQGNGFGGKANLSIKNEFTLLMPQWSNQPLQVEVNPDEEEEQS